MQERTTNDMALAYTKHDPKFDANNQIRKENKENVEEQQEFNFAGIDPQGTLMFADEIFDNGQIRSTLSSYDQSLIFTATHSTNSVPLRPPTKNLVIAQHKSFCPNQDGSRKITSKKMMLVEVESSRNKCKKSNSTGFSKKWRFRQDMNRRSNSDGKDVFVWLSSLVSMTKESHERKEKNVVLKKGKCGMHKSDLSAHERLYVMNRKRRENNKRKSFLPYRKQLIGFFTNVNGFSRNLHPF